MIMHYSDVIAKTFVSCYILALIIWVSSLLDGLRVNNNTTVRTNFLPSMNVSSVKEIEKFWCKDEHFCELEGDIRVEAKTGIIYMMAHNITISSNSTSSRVIRPYVRPYVYNVRHWTVKLVSYSSAENIAPKCTKKYYNPAILFSCDGYSKNHYHYFSDVIFPLYMTSFGHLPELHLLVTDYSDWFISKTRAILEKLSRYPIIDIDRESDQVHCYHKVFVGLKFHGDLIVNKSSPEYAAGLSMQSFRQFLRNTCSLERKMTTVEQVNMTSPRLMIVSRKSTRLLLNQDDISELAKRTGFDVVSAEAEISTNQCRFAQIVNSCDVLMGIHGAGLVNMLFLPDNAVIIQMIPYGPLEYWAFMEFRDPTWDMNITYMDYKVSVPECTLSQQYAPDDPIIINPTNAMEWATIHEIYLLNVNFTIDVGRFQGTMVEAMNKLLHH